MKMSFIPSLDFVTPAMSAIHAIRNSPTERLGVVSGQHRDHEGARQIEGFKFLTQVLTAALH